MTTYAKGYAAGRKRVAAELDEWRAIHDRIHAQTVARRDAFFCAALTGLLQSTNWEMNGKKVTNSDQHIELAKRFADRAMKVMP